MNNKLFLVCPDCCMEHFIKEHYGNDVLFITALGAVFNVNDLNYMNAIAHLLEREAIQEMIIVNDTSCRLIKGVIGLEKGFGTPAEEIIFKLMIDHYSALRNVTAFRQRASLAELNVHRQVNEMATNTRIQETISQNHICLKGLVTTKEENRQSRLTYTLNNI